MSDQKQDNESPQIDYEGSIPVLRAQVSEVERKQAEAERRDKEYKDRQMTLDTWLVIATVSLVITTIALGGVQACYMHRQWKLNADGLSKAGDQLGAAKDAAYASKKASDTAAQALKDNESSFSDTLAQMREQSAAQNRASKAASESARIAKAALHISERAYVLVPFPYLNSEGTVSQIALENSGHIPSGTAEFILHELTANESGAVLECHWAKMSVTSIAPGSSVTGRNNPAITVPTPKASRPSLEKSEQTIMIAGSVSYNDGFPDDPAETIRFCSQTTYNSASKALAWFPCDPTLIIPKLESIDGYPNSQPQ